MYFDHVFTLPQLFCLLPISLPTQIHVFSLLLLLLLYHWSILKLNTGHFVHGLQGETSSHNQRLGGLTVVESRKSRYARKDHV
jgi:hypothetical protein